MLSDARCPVPLQSEEYYETFMQQYNISRCFFMKALGRSEEPLALTQSASIPALSTGITLTTLEVRSRVHDS